MENSIKINYEAVDTDASQIESTASMFQESSLNPEDSQTTMHINENIHSTFTEAQDLIVIAGTAMNQEADNIRSTGCEFEEYDAMLADFIEQAG